MSRPLRVLIACECSGTVRDAFLALGHDAWSCDLKPDEKGSNRHMIASVLDVIAHPEVYGAFDLLSVMHPPCTRLCNSGVRWLDKPARNPIADLTPAQIAAWPRMSDEERLALTWSKLDEGAALFDACLNSYIPHVAVENPVMHKHAKARINFGGVAPFYVQPWHFGTDEAGPDNEKKRTGFWCKGLPPLQRTGTLDGSTARDSVHMASPGKNRATERSRFFPGMAAAIADQWSRHVTAELVVQRRAA